MSGEYGPYPYLLHGHRSVFEIKKRVEQDKPESFKKAPSTPAFKNQNSSQSIEVETAPSTTKPSSKESSVTAEKAPQKMGQKTTKATVDDQRRKSDA